MAGTLGPGEQVEYIVTYLEMHERPGKPVPPRPANLNTALLCATDPPVDYFLYLYGAVGAEHEWTDWLDRPRAEQEAFIENPDILLYTVMVGGWPGGFFMLDSSLKGTCDLAYFGLVPQAIGRGLSGWLLATAVEAAWDRAGVERVTVNTNTLDHPRALGMYQKIGFEPVRRETHTRTLTRARPV